MVEKIHSLQVVQCNDSGLCGNACLPLLLAATRSYSLTSTTVYVATVYLNWQNDWV